MLIPLINYVSNRNTINNYRDIFKTIDRDSDSRTIVSTKLIDAVGKLKLYFEASDAALLDLEFMLLDLVCIFGTWHTSSFKAAILASIAAYKNLFIWVVTIIEGSTQSGGHTSRYMALFYSQQ